jgi:hypothetical protein
MTNKIQINLKSKRRNTVLVCVDDNLHEKLSKVAKKNGLSMSSTCYEILSQTIDLVD